MKNPILRILYAALLLSGAGRSSAQDLHFSQFYETPLLRNPALAGLFSGDIRIQSVYRNQWQSVSNPYQTVSLNGEYKVGVGKTDDYLTIGGEILYDKAGTIAMTTTHILPAVNYHKSMSAERNVYLSLGFMGGYVQRKFDRSKMTTNEQFDGSSYNDGLDNGETLAGNSYSYFDGSAGMSFNSQIGENPDNNFYAGIALWHFNKPKNISFYSNTALEMTPKWVYSAGMRISTSEKSYLTVMADYNKQGSYTEIIGGGMLSYKLDDNTEPKYLFHCGAFMRLNDAIIPVAKIESRPLTVALSYDVNVSSLAVASKGRGGLELSITYLKFIIRDRSTKDAVRCPRF